jgi:VanZ family protein
MRRPVTVAAAAAAAVILSAPFVQQAFTAANEAWGAWLRPVAVTASLVVVAAAVGAALWRIRDRRLPRYLALLLSLTLGAAYISVNALSFTESFHFIEYGILGWLFYRGARPPDDGSLVIVPLLAGVLAGTLDEWFQWFIPIRAGEARDVALNAAAIACGILFALSIEPPTRVRLRLERRSQPRVAAWAVAAGGTFAVFVWSVHVGYEVRDPDVGPFLSRYTAAELTMLAEDRAARWRSDPPLALSRLSQEDQYLTEGLWHVQQRNEAWAEEAFERAWRENRIVERYFSPVLDTPTYAGRSGQRWPAQQAADADIKAAEAAARRAVDPDPALIPTYRYPLLVWRSTGS